MLDETIKTIFRNELSQFNTTMQCKVITVSPLVIQPISEGEPYPLIASAKCLKQWTLQYGDVYPPGDFVTGDTTFSGGEPVAFALPLEIGNTVLVIFSRKDLTDAVIVGVIE